MRSVVQVGCGAGSEAEWWISCWAGMCVGSKLDLVMDRLGRDVCRTVRVPPSFPALRRLAVVPDREQPVLDREPDSFLDQRPCDAGNAGTVGALPYQSFHVGDGREGQGYGNAVSFGFFRGHAKNAIP